MQNADPITFAKVPAEHASHTSPPPVDDVPGAHGTSAVFKLFAYLPDPAVMHEAAAADEYLPLAQSAHTVAVPPAPILPAEQSVHDLSTVLVQATV